MKTPTKLSVFQKKYFLTRILIESWFFQVSDFSIHTWIEMIEVLESFKFIERFDLLMSGDEQFLEWMTAYTKNKKRNVAEYLQKIHICRLKISEYIHEYTIDKEFDLSDELNSL